MRRRRPLDQHARRPADRRREVHRRIRFPLTAAFPPPTRRLLGARRRAAPRRARLVSQQRAASTCSFVITKDHRCRGPSASWLVLPTTLMLRRGRGRVRRGRGLTEDGLRKRRSSIWLIPPFFLLGAELASVVELLAWSPKLLQGAGLMLLRCVVDAMRARSAHRDPPHVCSGLASILSKLSCSHAIPKIASK